jgi:hypothetical protein
MQSGIRAGMWCGLGSDYKVWSRSIFSSGSAVDPGIDPLFGYITVLATVPGVWLWR